MSSISKRPPLPTRYEDTYSGGDRIGSFDQGRQISSFSTSSFNMPSYHQYNSVDYLSGYSGRAGWSAGGRSAAGVSAAGEFGLFDADPGG